MFPFNFEHLILIFAHSKLWIASGENYSYLTKYYFLSQSVLWRPHHDLHRRDGKRGHDRDGAASGQNAKTHRQYQEGLSLRGWLHYQDDHSWNRRLHAGAHLWHWSGVQQRCLLLPGRDVTLGTEPDQAPRPQAGGDGFQRQDKGDRPDRGHLGERWDERWVQGPWEVIWWPPPWLTTWFMTCLLNSGGTLPVASTCLRNTKNYWRTRMSAWWRYSTGTPADDSHLGKEGGLRWPASQRGEEHGAQPVVLRQGGVALDHLHGPEHRGGPHEKTGS